MFSTCKQLHEYFRGCIGRFSGTCFCVPMAPNSLIASSVPLHPPQLTSFDYFHCTALLRIDCTQFHEWVALKTAVRLIPSSFP